MATPSAEEQLRFLSDLQRILDEGTFVATYKYALILALADYAVMHGNDEGGSLHLTTHDIAESFVKYYWRQAIPFTHAGTGTELQRLKHSTGNQPVVLTRIVELHAAFNGSLSTAKRDAMLWGALLKSVAATIASMPLWKLQVVGRSVLPIFYVQHDVGNTINLLPAAVYNFRRFYDLIRNLVQGAWTSHIRRINRNILGHADLADFLFGAERSVQFGLRTLLREVQSDKCFYCNGRVRDNGEIDHFVPWSRYPIDLGHNFVLAHCTCNNNKRDFLASSHHLEKWQRRNHDLGSMLATEFDVRGILHNIAATKKIAFWAYSQAEGSRSNLWHQRDVIQPIEPSWRELFGGRND
jgi:hypothetical protein